MHADVHTWARGHARTHAQCVAHTHTREEGKEGGREGGRNPGSDGTQEYFQLTSGGWEVTIAKNVEALRIDHALRKDSLTMD